MFTGLVEETGRVVEVQLLEGRGDIRLRRLENRNLFALGQGKVLGRHGRCSRITRSRADDCKGSD